MLIHAFEESMVFDQRSSSKYILHGIFTFFSGCLPSIVVVDHMHTCVCMTFGMVCKDDF